MNLMNKKEAAKIIIFLAIFIFLFISVSYIMRTNGDTKDRFAGFYAEERDSIDVLMIGSSTVATSFCSPYMWNRYGFTSYPMSSNSQRPKAIKYVIEEGLHYQSPQLIVIEMRTFIADDNELAKDEGHIRETVDNMKYSLRRIRAINALTEEFDDKWPFYLDIIKYHSNIGVLAKPAEWKKFDFSVKDKKKGFQIFTNRETFRLETTDTYSEERVAIPDNQEEVLRDLLKYLKEKDIEALFVVSPRASLEDYDKMMNYCQDIVEDEGFEFLNLNYKYDEMGFDYRYDIEDGAHTNVWGALKCSDYLGKYIVDNYSIDREYSKKVIKDWDDSYDLFMQMYNEIKEE